MDYRYVLVPPPRNIASFHAQHLSCKCLRDTSAWNSRASPTDVTQASDIPRQPGERTGLLRPRCSCSGGHTRQLTSTRMSTSEGPGLGIGESTISKIGSSALGACWVARHWRFVIVGVEDGMRVLGKGESVGILLLFCDPAQKKRTKSCTARSGTSAKRQLEC